MRNRKSLLSMGAALAVVAVAFAVPPTAASAAAPPPRLAPGKIDTKVLSAGAKLWFEGPKVGTERARAAQRLAFGSNVDANDPQRDLGAGQSETAIAASGSTVLAAWNDVSGFFVQPSTDVRASGTGVGLSTDRGRTFRDLIGLRNDNTNQQWFGDPVVVAIDANHFAVGSLYLPANKPDCTTGPVNFDIALEILTVGPGGTVSFGLPVVAATGGDVCPLIAGTGTPAPDLAFLDKEWMSYDSQSRTFAVSYSRLFFGFGGQAGTGQVGRVRRTGRRVAGGEGGRQHRRVRLARTRR